jgi:class 3 adenylate cyclase
MEIEVNNDTLEKALAKIEGEHSWSPRVISRLENFVRTADDEDLFRVNPLQWAQGKNVDEHEAIDLFLHAVKADLFYMEWNVICPCCGKITQSLRDLHNVESQITCTVCFRSDQATLDDYVQIAFTLSSTIRSLRFHHPETLTLEDYCFNYLYERGVRFPEGDDMKIQDFLKKVTLHFSTFLPGENVEVEADVIHGIYFCNDLFSEQSFAFAVDEEPTAELQKVHVRFTENGFEVNLPRIQPGEMHIAHKFMTGTFYPLHPGKVVIEVEQASTSKAALLIWGAPYEAIRDYPDVRTIPSLTAKLLFTNQTFHDLFKSEVFQESQGFGVKDVTFLFTDLKSSTQLYHEIGDLNAFAMVREHYGVLNRAVVNHHGIVVKTIGDAVMATFFKPVDAVAAGLQMLNEMHQLNMTSDRGGLILKIGIHRGAAISVTLNNRIDYFGQTVNIASKVQGSAGGEEIYVTENVHDSAGIADLLRAQECQGEPILVQLKGIQGEVKVYRIAPVLPAGHVGKSEVFPVS